MLNFQSVNCSICASESVPFGTATILEKYPAEYYRCDRCGFVWVDNPHWLDEAYDHAIAMLDTGALQRNIHNTRFVSAAISLLFPKASRFIDYAGGHGIFVRLMRDRGFDFRWDDRYARNEYARGFEHRGSDRYDLLTAFEVLEHVPNPMDEIRNLFRLSDNILVSTELLPIPPPNPPGWWYYAINSGQHISFYSARTLRHIANETGTYVISSGPYHLFTPKPVNQKAFSLARRKSFGTLVNLLRQHQSLTQSDHDKFSEVTHANDNETVRSCN